MIGGWLRRRAMKTGKPGSERFLNKRPNGGEAWETVVPGRINDTAA